MLATLAEARREANDILTRAQKVADEIARARTSPRPARSSSGCASGPAADIEAEKQRAIADLRAEVADLALAAAGRVVGETMTDDRQRRLVEEFLAEAAPARRLERATGRTPDGHARQRRPALRRGRLPARRRVTTRSRRGGASSSGAAAIDRRPADARVLANPALPLDERLDGRGPGCSQGLSQAVRNLIQLLRPAAPDRAAAARRRRVPRGSTTGAQGITHATATSAAPLTDRGQGPHGPPRADDRRPRSSSTTDVDEACSAGSSCASATD